MKILLGLWLSVFLWTLLGVPARASVVDLATSTPTLNVTSDFELALSSPEQTDPTDLNFVSNTSGVIKQGYSTQNLWLKISFKNSSDTAIQKLLYFDAPLIGELLAREESADGIIEEVSGPGIPLQFRAVPVRWGAFNVLLDPGQEKTFYIQRNSHHALNTQAFISEPEVFEEGESHAKTIFFFYLGGIMCLVVYNLFLGLSTGQKDYWVYSIFATSFALTALSLHNVLDTYIFPNNTLVFSRFLMFFSSMSILSASFFVERFLNITKSFKVGYWGCRILRACGLITLAASFFVPHFRSLFFFGYFIDVVIAVALVFFLFCGFYSLFRNRYGLAYYFLFSWFAVMIGVFIWIAALHGFIATSPLTQYSLIIANLGEMLILALGLAYKLKILDDEKKQALRAAADKDRYHRLVKVLSHDVANTVSGVVFHAESLDAISDGSTTKEHVGRISRLAERLSKILDNVRQEEVYNAIKSQALLEKVDLRSACLEAIEHFSWELNEKRIHVDMNVPENIMVRANRSAFVNQVLVNLLSNCVKFSDAGSNILLHTEDTPDEMRLLVCDQGIGIPKEKLADLFHGESIFSRRGTEKERGSGFGTKLIGEYMKLFGGTVHVESIERIGDTMTSGTIVRLVFPKKI